MILLGWSDANKNKLLYLLERKGLVDYNYVPGMLRKSNRDRTH